jgi:hypothetical protein
MRPAGEDRLRPTWERRPNPEGATPEYVNVWLGDLPEGAWTLRIVADLPDAGTPLVAERVIQRR